MVNCPFSDYDMFRQDGKLCTVVGRVARSRFLAAVHSSACAEPKLYTIVLWVYLQQISIYLPRLYTQLQISTFFFFLVSILCVI